MKFNYKKIVLLGFSFFAISLTWSLYNSFVPLFLRKYIQSNAMVGFIMTLDNYAGIFMQPIFGTLSDRTRTGVGRRMPYLLVGMPAAAALVIAIPLHWSLMSLIVSIIALNIIMALLRAPAIALMPDMTPEPLRTKANGLINLMGGLGAIVAYYSGSYLYKINKSYPFFIASALIIVGILTLYTNIKEERDALDYSKLMKVHNCEELDEEERIELRKNIMLMLTAIFCWFFAFNGIEAFFTIYGKYYLGVDEATAASTLTFFSLAMVIFAIPAGLIGAKIGKKKAIILGLIIMILLFGSLLFFSGIRIISIIFGFAGVCWSLININSYPLIIGMTDSTNIGKFTGYYYLFSSLAAIISPPLLGKLMDILDYSVFFVYSGIGFVLALVFILLADVPEESKDRQITIAKGKEDSGI